MTGAATLHGVWHTKSFWLLLRKWLEEPHCFLPVPACFCCFEPSPGLPVSYLLTSPLPFYQISPVLHILKSPNHYLLMLSNFCVPAFLSLSVLIPFPPAPPPLARQLLQRTALFARISIVPKGRHQTSLACSAQGTYCSVYFSLLAIPFPNYCFRHMLHSTVKRVSESLNDTRKLAMAVPRKDVCDLSRS